MVQLNMPTSMDEKKKKIIPLYHREYYNRQKPNTTIKFLKHLMFPHSIQLHPS